MKLLFVGFGEAAYNIALGLKSEGLTDMLAYDVNSDNPQFASLIKTRAEDTGVALFDNLETACSQQAGFIFSLTSAGAALDVAKSVFPYLKKGQVYVDMNSAAPTVKQRINSLPREDGALFCDAGVMGPVPGNRHAVPMFVSGEGACAFGREFSRYGMKLKVLDAPAGGASAMKMLKSVIMKGLPQLMFEAFEGAEKFGVLDTLVASLKESLEKKSVEEMADSFIARTLIHSGRRSAEMRDSLSTLQALGVETTMTRAIIAKLDAMAAQNWHSLLGENGDKLPYREALLKYMTLKN